MQLIDKFQLLADNHGFSVLNKGDMLKKMLPFLAYLATETVTPLTDALLREVDDYLYNPNYKKCKKCPVLLN